MRIRPGAKNREPGIGKLFRASLMVWATGTPRRFLSFAAAAWRMRRADGRRKRNERMLNTTIPYVVAISPTMRCNYACRGCYSRGRSTENELTITEISTLFSEAERLGVLSILITGGEPLLLPGLLDLFTDHRRLFFVLITNGSLLTEETADFLGRRGNVLTLISVEGELAYNDASRVTGAHDKASQALRRLKSSKAFFGFASTVTAANVDYLSTDAFTDSMIESGCSVGYFTEYVPCGETVCSDWLLDRKTRDAFRERILELRRSKPIILIQFPHDEYGEANLCSAAGRYSLHISSQGDVEPCPFVPVSSENIRSGGLSAAVTSPFLRAIRRNPGLLSRQRHACSLFEHREDVERLAAEHAQDRPPVNEDQG